MITANCWFVKLNAQTSAQQLCIQCSCTICCFFNIIKSCLLKMILEVIYSSFFSFIKIDELLNAQTILHVTWCIFFMCILKIHVPVHSDYFWIEQRGNLQKVRKTIEFNKLKSELNNNSACRTYLSFQIMQ